MPLLFVAPPLSVYNTYQQSVLDFMGPHPPEAQLFHLPVGTLGLAELSAGAALADIVPSGCRILASWPDGTHTSCEMTNPSFYGNAEFRNFVTGGPADVALARIAQAQSLDALRSEDYELHFLSAPGIYLEVLHLVCQGKGGDLFLPLVSLDPQLSPDTVLNEATFLALARANAVARGRVASSDPLSS